MRAVKVTLTDAVHEYLLSRVGDRSRFATPDEYIRDLIHQDQQRRARLSLESMLAAGFESGEPLKVAGRWKEQIRRLAKQQRTKGRRNGRT